ncbi:P450-derived glycosyltransferase activator [Amycolatopsis sp. NPDC059235]|uniref:cytochrome P450 family protein n=1 Tax=Amycolatopsis sp. NPDC059235 TaxID=3346782 RepID=UPI00366FD075
MVNVRSVQWARGAAGDPYAVLLRGRPGDPAALFSAVRERGSLWQSLTGAWVTGDHVVGRAVLGDRRFGSGCPEPCDEDRIYVLGSPLPLQHVFRFDNAFLGLGHDEHDRLRSRAAPAFGEGAVNKHRATVERVTGEVLAGLDGGFDLITDFARPVTSGTLRVLTGLPESGQAQLTEFCADAAPVLDAMLCPPTLDATRRLVASINGLRQLLSAVDNFEAATMLTAVLGVEVAATMICETVRCLLDHPDEHALLRNGSAAVGTAVEEALRMRPPIAVESRIAGEDVDLAGRRVEAGDQVVVLIGAANRDPDVYREPDRFSLARSQEHLSLAGGLHATFVAPLARLQASVAVGMLTERFPGLRAAGDAVRRNRAVVMRGFASFPVVLT